MSPADALDAERLRAAVSGQLIGHELLLLPQTTSTNEVVAQMAAEHREGLVVIAEEQSAGRGQYGRRWESAAGQGLWMSVLLRPRLAVAQSAQLTDLLARTIAEQIGSSASIKPPNDVYLGGRKVAGVLVEMKVEPNGSYCAVAGMGINVNQTAEDFPPELRETATSLALSFEQPIDRTRFAIELLRRLEANYHAFTTR
ncbi:hypothetical protein BH20VER2_BH20VER2_15720 [soil metagenome]|nr:biotin--[acetyl-CoA-carboxylase] ligase [Chthoniobacterales bacterium]